jgi:hypothetical protein
MTGLSQWRKMSKDNKRGGIFQCSLVGAGIE